MDWVVIIALLLIAVIGAALTGWGMWLEHRQERRVLDIIAAAIEVGRDPPPALLDRLVGREQPADPGLSKRALWRSAMFLILIAAACFVASWLVGNAVHERVLLLISSITGAAGIGLLIVQNLGHRAGL